MPSLDAVLAGFQPFVKSPTTAAAYSSMQDERVNVRAGEMERLNALISVIETAEVPVDHSSDLSARLVESSNHRQAFVNLVETIVAREQSLIEDGALHQCFTHFSLAQKVLLLHALEKNHSIPEEFVADMNELRDLLSSAIELDYQVGADGLGDPAQHGIVLDAADFVFLTRRACELLAPEVGLRPIEVLEEDGYTFRLDSTDRDTPNVKVVVPAPAHQLRFMRPVGTVQTPEEVQDTHALLEALKGWRAMYQAAYEPILVTYCDAVGPLFIYDTDDYWSDDSDSESDYFACESDASDSDSESDADTW
ncbi:hypothetical protein EV122DRAFT_270720 [Schizophyllum commune]